MLTLRTPTPKYHPGFFSSCLSLERDRGGESESEEFGAEVGEEIEASSGRANDKMLYNFDFSLLMEKKRKKCKFVSGSC